MGKQWKRSKYKGNMAKMKTESFQETCPTERCEIS